MENKNKIFMVRVKDLESAEIVSSLAQEIWQEYYPKIISQEQIDYMLKKFQTKEAILQQIEKEAYQYYLLNDDHGNAIGYLAIRVQKEGLFLSKLYIHIRKRGQGLARKVMGFVEKLAKEKGLNRVFLTVNKNNTASISVYQKLGFVISSSVISDIGNGFVMDDFEMERYL